MTRAIRSDQASCLTLQLGTGTGEPHPAAFAFLSPLVRVAAASAFTLGAVYAL